MSVPYTFATATGSIPLSQLDANFNTGITIGNTSVLLGGTITTLNNLSLANVAITSVNTQFPNGYLANSNVVIGTTTINLGSTVTTVDGLTLSNVVISSGNVTISNVTTTNVSATTANISGTANISNLVVIGNETVGGNTTVTGNITGSKGTFTSANVSGTANVQVIAVTQNATVAGNATVTGNVSAANGTFTSANVSGTANVSTLAVIGNGTVGGNVTVTGNVSTSSVTLTGGTANGVGYLNTSKVLTTGTAFVFDGTNVGIGNSTARAHLDINDGTVNTNGDVLKQVGITAANVGAAATATGLLTIQSNDALAADVGGSIAFGGRYITASTAAANWAFIAGLKTNSGTGDLGGYLQFSTRASSGGAVAEKMRIDSSGNVGIGTTSMDILDQVGAGRPLVVKRSDSNTTINGSTASISIVNSDTTTSNTAQLNFAAITGANTSGYSSAVISCIFGARTNAQYPTGQLVFSTSSTLNAAPTEKMRIDSSGKVGVNTGGAAYGGTVFRLAVNDTNYCMGINATAGGTTDMIDFYSSGTFAGKISSNGATTAYTSASDYRLKDNIVPMTGALAKVSALKPCTYKWKSDGSDGEGFIAHELAEVCPYAVNGEKDEVDSEGNIKAQSIDTSFLVATLTAALQEAHGLIKDLQARVDALEAK